MINQTEFSQEQQLFHGVVPKVMGTTLEMMTVGTPENLISSVWDKICEEAERLDCILNRFSESSEVARINDMGACSDVQLSTELADILRLSVDYWYKTEGLFDITKGKMTEISLSGDGRLTIKAEDVKIDFGGIAKGYLQQHIYERLRHAGVACAFVDFGSSAIIAIGHHPYGETWNISLPDPFTGRVLDEFRLRDMALSTSGNTPGYTGHIINPATGKAIIEKKMVSVTGSDPLDIEILSTVLMMADEGQKRRIMRFFPGTDAKTYIL